jgi:hypothetical protein
MALALTACATPPATDTGTETAPLLSGIFRSPAPRTPEPIVVRPPQEGADADSLKAEYGEPDFVRNEQDSQLWRYDGEACALFLFLYREGEDGALAMRHAETSPAIESGGMDIACLRSVITAATPNS